MLQRLWAWYKARWAASRRGGRWVIAILTASLFLCPLCGIVSIFSPSKPTPTPSPAAPVRAVATVALATETPRPSAIPPTVAATQTAAPSATLRPSATAAPSLVPSPLPSPTVAPTQKPSSTPAPAQPTKAPPTAAPAVPAVSCPGGCTEEKPGCVIKGNINDKGAKLYHIPGMPQYKSTKIDPSKGERWFCTVEEAQAAGWVRAGN